jgi:hypothetical protein
MKKIALFAYNGEMMCFSHVMLYALDFFEKGYEVNVVIEGSATGLIKELAVPDSPFHALYSSVRENQLIGGICQACSSKMKTLGEARKQGLPIVGELNGHPSLERYVKAGFEIFTF